MDNELKFSKHVPNLCLKAGRKPTALTSLIRILPFDKKILLLKSFVESQFAYTSMGVSQQEVE